MYVFHQQNFGSKGYQLFCSLILHVYYFEHNLNSRIVMFEQKMFTQYWITLLMKCVP